MPLKRTITLPMLTLYGLGNILGAGIYVLIGEVAGVAGYFTPLSFLLASLLVVTTAFTYAELSSRYPISAGEALYLFRAFGSRSASMVIGLMIATAGMLSAATIAVGFTGYIDLFIDAPSWMVILILLCFLGGVAIWGIQQSVRTASLLTILEIIGLLIIIWIGRDHLAELELSQLSHAIPSDLGVWIGVFSGAFLAFYAFIGFEDMVNVAEEVVQPERTLPRAIILALLIATLLYTLVSLVSITTVSPAELSSHDAPLALIYEQTTGEAPIIISLIGMMAVINGALIQIIMASRIFYGMSRQGWIPTQFGTVNESTQTPIVATLTVTGVVLLLALLLPILTLAGLTSLFILVVFSLMHLSLLIIKQKEPAPDTGRCYPYWIPLVGFLTNVAFVITVTAY